MSDELDPDRWLASAALDNEVTPDERARVAASYELLAEVGRYRSIAEQMRSVEIPPASRASALAAALAVFDELSAEPPEATLPQTAAPVLVSLHERRQRRYGWLTAVAAAAVVALVGAAVLSNRSGDDQKSSAPTELAGTAAKAGADTGLAADSAATGTATGAATEAAPPIAPTGAAAGASPLGDPWAGAPPLQSEDDLRAFSATFSAAAAPASSTAAGATDTTIDSSIGTRVGPPADTTAATTAESTAQSTADSTSTNAAATAPSVLAAIPPYVVCEAPPGGTIVPVIYLGQRVYLVRDDATGELRVLDSVSCAVILTTPIN